jgi:hypothetical protein
MKFAVRIFVFVLLCGSIAFGQEATREQKLEKISELNNQNKELEQEIILPDEKDVKQAEQEGFSVFRILPREKYDRKLSIQGGGSYYSFTTKSHDYQKIPEISLEQNNLKVGFGGANYGLIADLGETPLTAIGKETGEVNFLINYKPPTDEPEVRAEQRRTWNYEVDGFLYKSHMPAVVGHSYVLRAISFDAADVLVAFKIHRKDADGSLIIFWKAIQQFAKPTFTRADETPRKTSDAETEREILSALRAKGFYNVTVDASVVPLTLRGTVPKGKLEEVARIAVEICKKPVKVEIAER